jgi:hypothetical protein
MTPKLVDMICVKTIRLYCSEYQKGKSKETTGNWINQE